MKPKRPFTEYCLFLPFLTAATYLSYPFTIVFWLLLLLHLLSLFYPTLILVLVFVPPVLPLLSLTSREAPRSPQTLEFFHVLFLDGLMQLPS